MEIWFTVKTTISVPDGLFRRAKALAATRGISLKKLFTESLERQLRATPRPLKPAWKKLHGALAPLRRETGRIDDLVAAEFEQIDAEDAH
jgi:hypothetical protein